ncbi:MAG: exodeoxyribonuclease VII small subunit [Paracoccaceae bacterium]
MSSKSVKDMSFEEAMETLETVVGQLDTGAVPLDESIKLYERGAALKAYCEAKLKSAEEKVAKITTDTDGNAVATEPVEIS